MAEEIGFNYVGEERKDPSNVIDYNINSEQTKDLFAEINANNQTTTGMATVIPGINAPKLRAATSIVGGAGGSAQYAEIALSYNGTMSQSEYYNFNDMTITGDSFVSIDPNNSNRILIEPGIYFAFVYINVRNATRVFYTAMRYFYSDGTLGPELLDVDNSTELLSISTIFKIDTTGGYLRIGIRPDNGNVNRFTNSVLKLMKLG